MQQSYIKKILSARVYDVAIKTPIDRAHFLSERLHNNVLIKREDLQPVFSFKLRGAFNKMSQLSEKQKAQGVIAASAGNHAQGVALAAKHLGIKAIIVMPQTTPEIKVASVKARGARVILHGDTFDEAAAHAEQLIKQHGYTYIHPYDDSDIIAGQGTIGVEILQQHTDDLHAIFIPVGGGGLIAGISAYVKYLRPEIKIIGVEAEDSACLAAAMRHGRRVSLTEVGIFADGVAVAQIGRETFKLARDCVDEVITVTTDELCAAVKDIYDDTRAISEPAGALGLAGLKKYVRQKQLTQKNLLTISSGANVNFDRLRHIAERAEVGEKREAVIAVTIPEKPGSFKSFCQTLGKRNITEFNYRYHAAKDAHIFVGVQTGSNGDGRKALIKLLKEKNYPVVDMTDNEMAKVHIRYMVGGHAVAENEVLYRFEFPERPGALMNFLRQLGQNWNISLFHYRNHGAAYGRVLVGLQVEAHAKKELSKFLDGIGYRFHEETDNPAYQLFLS